MSKISFDLDGVLYIWTKYAHEYCLENHYTTLTREEFFDPKFDTHTKIFWDNLVRIPMIYYRTKMQKEYVELLNKFNKAGWDIFYLTNRPQEVECVTYNWLEDAKVPQLRNLHFVDKKSSVIRLEGIEYHIDDRANCIEDVKNFVTKSYLVDAYWNEPYEEPKNCKRINNVLQVEELL